MLSTSCNVWSPAADGSHTPHTHTHTALLTVSLTQSEWDNRVGHRVKISCAGINNSGRQETHKEYRARYWPGFVTTDKSRAITIRVTISVSTQQWPWQPPQSNRELCHGTAEQQRALPLSPSFHPNHLVYNPPHSGLQKQGWISKSPGCLVEEKKNPTLSDHCLSRGYYQSSASWE